MSDNVYIGFCQDIQKKQVDNLISTCKFAITAHNPKNLHIVFASGGGHIGLAFNLFTFLKSLPAKVIMHAVANIDSCAVNVFLAGAERYATSNASFMLHPAKTSFKNDVSLSIRQLQHELRILQRDQNLVINNISENTKLNPEEAKNYVEVGASFSATEALQFGIINEIKDFKLTKNCQFFQI